MGAAQLAHIRNRPHRLDEPTCHLNSASSRDILAVLRQLNTEGRTVVLISHDPLVLEGADAQVGGRSAAGPTNRRSARRA